MYSEGKEFLIVIVPALILAILFFMYFKDSENFYKYKTSHKVCEYN